jgi:uncharacterized membrane protein YjgN (DUF898 family)
MTNSPGDGQPQGPYYPPVDYAPDHPKATTALVLGILGIVICGLVAPFAWKVGRDTVREIDASQGRLGGRGSAQAGYVLGVVGTVLLGLVLLAVVLLGLGLAVIATSSSAGVSG